MKILRVFLLLLTLVGFFQGTAAMASLCENNLSDSDARDLGVVKKFFANYVLMNNWEKFRTEQSKLLSSGLVTFLRAYEEGQRDASYQGAEGYFKSLKDWSKVFSTTSDFRFEIVDIGNGRAVVRLHGTLKLSHPINGLTELRDDQHSWTEFFSLTPDGKIEALDIRMNLFE